MNKIILHLNHKWVTLTERWLRFTGKPRSDFMKVYEVIKYYYQQKGVTLKDYKFKLTTMLTLDKELYDFLTDKKNIAGYLKELVEKDYKESCQDSQMKQGK